MPATRLEKAVGEVDAAFRAAVVDEVKGTLSVVEDGVKNGEPAVGIFGRLTGRIWAAHKAIWGRIFGVLKFGGGKSIAAGAGPVAQAVESADKVVADAVKDKAEANLAAKLSRRRRDAGDARLQKAVGEVDAAYRQALMNDLAQANAMLGGALGANSSPSFFSQIFGTIWYAMCSPARIIGNLINPPKIGGIPISDISNLVSDVAGKGRRRRSPDGSDGGGSDGGSDKGDNGGSDNGGSDNGGSDNGGNGNGGNNNSKSSSSSSGGIMALIMSFFAKFLG